MATQRIEFTEWTPDQPSVIKNLSYTYNVIPAIVGYIPFPKAVDYSTAASEDLLSVAAGRFSSTTVIFGGGATKLFKFNPSTLGMDNISKSGNYSSVEKWNFIQFGQSVIAANGINKLQIYTLGSSTTFTDIPSSVSALGTITGGSSYTNGTYTNVQLTYVSGTTATTYPKATIVVSGGSVTSVTLTDGGFGFVDTTTILSANNSSIGGTGSGFSVPVQTLSENAPIAEYVTVVRDFVVAANLNGGTEANKVQWSDINDETNWTSGSGSQADSQIIPDGGNIHGVTGGEFGLILLDRAVVRMSYIGSPYFFQFDTIAKGIGCIEGNSVTKYGNTTYFLGEDGFYSCDGTTVTPIGNEKIDRWFWKNVNPAKLANMSATVDPSKKIVVWNFETNFAKRGVMIFNWQVNRWSYGETDATVVATSASSGKTIESLDYNYHVNAGSFVVGKQYSITELGTTNFISIGAEVNVVGARFTATGVGSGTGTAIDLEAAASYGFTLDTMTSSLDSSLFTGGRTMFAGARGAKVITFTGQPSPAQIDTGSFGSQTTTVVTLARPIVDDGSAMVAIKSRNLLSQVVDYGEYIPASTENRVSLRSSGKYHSLSIIPTGDRWYNTLAIEVDITPQGTR